MTVCEPLGPVSVWGGGGGVRVGWRGEGGGGVMGVGSYIVSPVLPPTKIIIIMDPRGLTVAAYISGILPWLVRVTGHIVLVLYLVMSHST